MEAELPNSTLTYYDLCQLLTSNPIALVSWNTEAFNMTPSISGTFCVWLSTRSRTTLPDSLLADSLTVGGRLQGRSVNFTSAEETLKKGKCNYAVDCVTLIITAAVKILYIFR